MRPIRYPPTGPMPPGATTLGYNVVETIANPLGWCPWSSLRNADLIPRPVLRCSEIDDLNPLVDALNKPLIDMMITSEYIGRPRRWATGIELTEEPVTRPRRPPGRGRGGDPIMREVNPIPEGTGP